MQRCLSWLDWRFISSVRTNAESFRLPNKSYRMNHNVNIVQACGRLLVVVLLTAAATSAQIRPIYDQGALGIAQDLKRLNTTASVLMIGAHPDDEDSSLLTYLARGEDARTAYLSLT